MIRLRFERRTGEELWAGPAPNAVMGLVPGDVVALEDRRVRVCARRAALPPGSAVDGDLELTLVVDVM